MNTYFLDLEPVNIEGKELYPLLPEIRSKACNYFDCEDEYLEDKYDIFYDVAIPCEDLDVSGWYDTCFTPLYDEGTGDNYLMLNGGGMDMSWQIAKSFIKHGYMPPLFCCNLPKMAGELDKEVLEACNESLKIKIQWLESYLENNNRILGD